MITPITNAPSDDPWLSLNAAVSLSGRAKSMLLSAALDGKVRNRKVGGHRFLHTEDVVALRRTASPDGAALDGRSSKGRKRSPYAKSACVWAGCGDGRGCAWLNDRKNLREFRAILSALNAAYAHLLPSREGIALRDAALHRVCAQRAQGITSGIGACSSC